MKTVRGALWVVVVILAMALAACASDPEVDEAVEPEDPADEPTDEVDDADEPEPADEPEVLEVTVGSQQFLPALNLFVADLAGFFEEEGLDVTIEYIRGGPLISNAVQSGDVDIGGMNYDGVILARERGFDYQLLYPAVMYDSTSPDVYLVVRTDADVESVADLGGHSVALRFGEIPELAVTALLVEAGVDPDDVEYVEVPFPDMPGALASGQIDAAHIVEPFLSAVLDEGIAEILYPDLDVVADRFLVNTWFAQGEWIDANPEVAERFVGAVDRATQLIIDDPDAVLPMAAQALETDEEDLARYFPERYVAATSVAPDELQAPIDFNLEWGAIETQQSYEDYLSPFFPIS